MNVWYRRFFRIYLITSVFLFFPGSSSPAQDKMLDVPFLFTDDDKLAQTELDQAISRSPTLGSDPYLNAPMTRLEYMLTKLEARLNGELLMDAVRDQISGGFDYYRNDTLKVPPRITPIARYKADVGHVIVGYRIEDLGRPKKSMRTTCDALLSLLQHFAPLNTSSYLYHNTILGVLTQDDLSKYTPVLETLVKSFVHKVILLSKSEEGRVMHALYCQRTREDAPIQYYRQSFHFK